MSPPARAYIALGANLPFEGLAGAALLARAVAVLTSSGLRARTLSSVWETPAWPPGSDQPNYFNAAIELDAGARSPQQLYAIMRSTEARFGRERRQRWGPRTLDLDILTMDGFVGEFGELTLPHPRLHERAFVLLPLAEIAPAWRHPLLGGTALELLAGVEGADTCRRLGRLAVAQG